MRVLRALLAALALAACSRAPEPPSAPAPKAPLTDRVKVLQGDVLIIDGKSVRLANAYAPQPIPHARCWAEAVAAKEATGELRSLIAEGREIALKPTGQKDEYERTIAYVSLDRLDLGETLIAMGLAARTPPSSPFRWCAGLSEETESAPSLQSLMDFPR